MRPSIVLLAGILGLASATSAGAAELRVSIDQSRPVALSGSAANVFVGNPAVADVTVIDRRHLLLTGKGYGSTNLVVLDGAGRSLMDSMVVVGAEAGGVTVQRGPAAIAYSCTPLCRPSRNGGSSPASASGASGQGVGSPGGPAPGAAGAVAAGAGMP